MADPAPFKYRAFLSYSHRDKTWGAWLHRTLEAYRIDKDLVGRETLVGPVPKTLQPIFRDREDFSAGHSLTAQTIAALEASQFLIVICSPNAAQSAYVNEEIRCFKALGRADRILPVIIDGEPGSGDPGRECFPSALRFKVGPDGALTDEREEPIAADAREQGDGKELAKQKLIAGLLGVGLDTVVRRAERARKRQMRVRSGIVGVLLILTVASVGGLAWARYELSRNEAFLDATLDRFTSLVNGAVGAAQSYSLPLPVTLRFLEEAEGILQVIARYGQPTPKLKQRQIAMLIAFADNYRDLGRTRMGTASGASTAAGRGTRPRRCCQSGVALGAGAGAPAHGRSAHGKGRRRRRADRVSGYRDIIERLAAADPNNANWQRDLSVAHNKVADVLVAQGNLFEALQSYRATLAIRERLAKVDPDNAVWQRDLTVSYDNVGDVLVAQGNLREALTILPRSLAIRERLAKADPGNAGWQRDLSVSYDKVGDVLAAQGNLTEALKCYRDEPRHRRAAGQGRSRQCRLAARSLGVAMSKIGDVLRGAGRTRRGADELPREPRHQRAAGQGRSRQCRLAARSLGVATTRSATC